MLSKAWHSARNRLVLGKTLQKLQKDAESKRNPNEKKTRAIRLMVVTERDKNIYIYIYIYNVRTALSTATFDQLSTERGA